MRGMKKNAKHALIFAAAIAGGMAALAEAVGTDPAKALKNGPSVGSPNLPSRKRP